MPRNSNTAKAAGSTLSQVALNDSIMIIAFAPLVALLLGLSAITVPWDTLITSVVLYIVIPVILAQVLRKMLLAKGSGSLERAVATLGPYSISALLLTLVLLFAFQGEAITRQPAVIAILAVPILIQVFINSGLAYLLNRKLGVAHCVAGPSSLIGASNFFELAVATAISLFGFQSSAALATVVGVLIEVPVMLLVVAIVNRSQHWYEAKVQILPCHYTTCPISQKTCLPSRPDRISPTSLLRRMLPAFTCCTVRCGNDHSAGC
ncbi:arsenical-resistance protein [Noviherbaspirillum suwonense]|uniref:Arsenical-resistance protein n=1 Tax=Noviherbaspirillum suwonense TaxID=1224511 RepID=A0ABY1PR81_9BURK|nr:arsenical-resistance protein [Noviherbaspirillum suwonense]